jgi:hypothetical protein
VIGVISVFGVYFMPIIIALLRGRHRAGSVAMVNVFLGWTVIGWLLALVWASSSDKPRIEH